MKNENSLPFTTEYGTESLYIETPDNTQWLNGVEPLKTLPAKWWNYFINLFTDTNVKTASDINDILTEMKSVLTAASIAVNPLLEDQLLSAIQFLIQNKVDGRNAYHGVVERSVIANPLPTTIATSLFTLATGTYPMTYFYKGTPVAVTGDKTATLTVAGLYYVYFDAVTGNIAASMTTPGFDANSNVIIATVLWNGTNLGLVSDERHSYNRNKSWHTWAHRNIGPMYTTGLAMTASGTGAGATFSVASGEIADEDIQFVLNIHNTCRVFFQIGANAESWLATPSARPFMAGPNNRPMYVRSDTYALVEMSASPARYINSFFYATTDLGVGISLLIDTFSPAIAGNNGYASAADARAAPWPNLAVLNVKREVKAIYRIVVSSDGTVQPIILSDDVRTAAAIPVGGMVSGVSAASVSLVPVGTLVSTNVQNGLAELDVNDQGANMLTRIKTVDGAGSGLDADLLDGIESARIIFGDNLRGTLVTVNADTITKSGYYYLNQIYPGRPPAAYDYLIEHTQYSGSDDYATQHAVSLGSNAYQYMRTKNGVSWHSWVPVWNASNDGVGSGLEADTVPGYGIGVPSVTTSDLNILLKNGNYAGQAMTGAPDTGYWQVEHVQYTDTNYAQQIAYNITNTIPLIKTRKKVGGVWGGWFDIWNSGTDGTGSGLDADTLDGIQIAQIYTATDIVAQGVNLLTILDGKASANTGTFYVDNSVPGTPYANYWYVEYFKLNSASIKARVTLLSSAMDVYEIVKSTTWGGWNRVWMASTDGPGSGLDADTLDGKQGTAYAGDILFTGVEGTVFADGCTQYGTYRCSDNAFATQSFVGFPVAIGAGGFTMQVVPLGGNYHLQRFTQYAAPYVYIRYSYYSGGIVWTGWFMEWNRENDGPGSGLDADTLDGYHAADLRAARTQYQGYISQVTTGTGLYNALSPHLPGIGDAMVISGCVNASGSNPIIVSRVDRVNATLLRIIGVSTLAYSNVAYNLYSDGAESINCSIAW